MNKFLLLPIALVAINVYGQTSLEPPIKQDFIVPVQMGTDTLKNGKLDVALTAATLDEMKQADASPDYAVMLTPIGNCGPLSLAEKQADHFTVKQQKGSAVPNASFCYIVFAKQKTPQRPPRPPQAPTPEELAEQQKGLHVAPPIPAQQQPGQPPLPQPGQQGPIPPLPGQPPPGPGNMPH